MREVQKKEREKEKKVGKRCQIKTHIQTNKRDVERQTD